LGNLNYFDIVIIVFTVLFGLKGLISGFIKEAFGFIGIIGGVYIASRLNIQAGQIIGNIFNITNEATLSFVGFVVVVVFIWISSYLIGQIISKIVKLSGLGIFDRVFGFIVGGGKVFMMASIIIYALGNISILKKVLPQAITNSLTYPLLNSLGATLIKLDPISNSQKTIQSLDTNIQESVKEQVDKTVQELKDKSNNLNTQIDKLKSELKSEN
jgi:membrane protein required for colicin V production